MQWRVKQKGAEENLAEMKDRRPLPLGRKEFGEWSDRIISGAMLDADQESLKFALCGMILSLGPTESHKEDAYFIHSLRKSAANQVAHSIGMEIKALRDARIAKEEEPKLKLALDDKKILADPKV